MQLSKRYGNDYFLYFFILDDSQYSKFYDSLSGPNRSVFLKNLEDRSLDSIINSQKNYYKVSMFDIAKIQKINNHPKRESRIDFETTMSYISKNKNSSLHLLCFVDTAPGINRKTTTSKIVYEKILHYDNNSKSFLVPKTRDVFLVNDPRSDANTQYTGPYHYHSSNNPAPDGYVGWMAGHATGKMGLKLSKQQVKNYKIQDLRNLEIEIDNFDHAKPIVPFKSTGEDLEKKTSEKGTNIEKFKYLTDMINNSIQSELYKSKKYITEDTPLTAHVKVVKSKNQDFFNNSYFGSIINLDKFLICQNNTSLGHFINFHRRMGNEKIVRSIVGSSKILNFSVIRRAISDTSFDKKEKTGSNLKTNQDDYLEKRLISTTEVAGYLSPAINSRCSIEEIKIVEPVTLESNEDVRSVSLKDYDLFHNYNYGKFTYDVEIVLQDGSEKFITDLYEEFKKSREKLEDYINAIEIPITFDYEGTPTNGSYNYNTKMSEVDNLITPPQITEILNNMRLQISGAHNFLTGSPGPDMDLEVLLSPQLYDPDVAGIIKLEVRKIESELLKILNSTAPAKTTYENPSNLRTNSIKANASGLKGMVFIKNHTNIVHELDGLGGLVADCANDQVHKNLFLTAGDLFSDALQLNFMSSKNGGNKNSDLIMEPSAFVEISKMGYSIEQEGNLIMKSLPSRPLFPKLSDNPGIKINKVEDKVSGGVNVLLTKNTLRNLSNAQKENIMVKIASMRNSSDSVQAGQDKTSMADYANNLLGGVSGVSVQLQSAIAEEIDLSSFAIIAKANISKIMPEVSEEIIDGIVQTLFYSKNLEEFDALIQDNYKDLISIKSTLKDIYIEMSLQIQQQEKIFDNKIKEKDYEKEFLEGEDEDTKNKNSVDSVKNNFEQQSFYAELIVPGLPPRKLSVVEMITILETTRDRLTGNRSFIRFVGNDSSKIKLINNGAILRV